MNFYVEKITKQQINLDNVYRFDKGVKPDNVKDYKAFQELSFNERHKKLKENKHVFFISFEGLTKSIHWNFEDEIFRDKVFDDLIDYISMKEFVYPGSEIDWNNEGYSID